MNDLPAFAKAMQKKMIVGDPNDEKLIWRLKKGITPKYVQQQQQLFYIYI